MMLRSKKRVYLSLLIVLILAIGVIIIKGRRKGLDSQVIEEASPSFGSIRNFIATTGIVEPQNRLEIKPPISGRIEEILVREGETVGVGQTLARMSSAERAALLDTARSQGDEVLAYWQEAYKPTPLISPIEGEVIVRAVEPGQTVTSADAVIVLSDRLIVKAQVDETDIGQVKVGQQASVSLDAYPQIKVAALVDHISYESKPVNNVTIYEVDILPQQVPDVFRSGMSANVEIIEQSRENTLVIPLEAIKQDKQGSYVLLKQGQGKKPVKRMVSLGLADQDNVELISGLGPEDIILIVTEKYRPPQKNNSGGSPLMPFGGRGRGR